MIIYKVTNLVNKKVYIGQTIRSLKVRWSLHLYKGDALYSAINKYGKENFLIEIIDRAETLDELNNKEIEYIKLLKTVAPNGYNIRLGGNSGGKLSEETRKKIGLSGKGRKHTEEWKRKASERSRGANNPMYGKSPNWGKVCSSETREKISIANKNRPKEITDRIRLKNLGKKKKQGNYREIITFKTKTFCLCRNRRVIFKSEGCFDKIQYFDIYNI